MYLQVLMHMYNIINMYLGTCLMSGYYILHVPYYLINEIISYQMLLQLIRTLLWYMFNMVQLKPLTHTDTGARSLKLYL